MPNNFINLNLASNRGAAIYGAVQQWQRAREGLVLILADFQQTTDGVDYSTLENAFGVPTGKGQTLNALVTNAVAELGSSANMIALVTQLGVTG